MDEIVDPVASARDLARRATKALHREGDPIAADLQALKGIFHLLQSFSIHGLSTNAPEEGALALVPIASEHAMDRLRSKLGSSIEAAGGSTAVDDCIDALRARAYPQNGPADETKRERLLILLQHLAEAD